MDIQKLEDEIFHQMRNGRDKVYIRVQDVQELEGVKVDTEDESRIFVKYDYLKPLIAKYKKKAFRESLKVDVKAKTVEDLPEKIMRQRNEEAWEK